MAHPLTICLALGSLILDLGTPKIELRWRHSVEHSLWTEQWQATEAGLVALSATIEGSGAGMDPPDDAVRTPTGWTWRPRLPPLPELVLARSGATADWQICMDGQCATIEALSGLRADGRPAHLAACDPTDAAVSRDAPSVAPSRSRSPAPATGTKDAPDP